MPRPLKTIIVRYHLSLNGKDCYSPVNDAAHALFKGLIQKLKAERRHLMWDELEVLVRLGLPLMIQYEQKTGEMRTVDFPIDDE